MEMVVVTECDGGLHHHEEVLPPRALLLGYLFAAIVIVLPSLPSCKKASSHAQSCGDERAKEKVSIMVVRQKDE